MSEIFNLLKLELASPLMDAMEKKDPKAIVSLAALALADNQSLKLYQAGNTDALKVFTDQVYEKPYEEVAALLQGFISASRRFTLILSGCKPEEANQIMIAAQKSFRAKMDLPSQEE